jgi:hypothetical protein
MQITHEQARKRIQLNLDGLLQSAEKATLSAHLHECPECQAYANEIREAENLLLQVMRRQWNAPPAPLSIAALTGNTKKISGRTLLTMRTAAISLVFFALFFSIWQFASSGPSNYAPMVVPSMPTPSAQTAHSTSTEITFENCEMMLYTVEANDTLASIANRFLVSEDEIMETNQLKTDTIRLSMELMIPICNFTPTGTIHPATFTTTNTPLIPPTTSTPGG